LARGHEQLDEKLQAFIGQQKMFFVATAGPQGRVNLSPKGLDGSFALLSPRRVAFLNLTGSGNETAAHLRLDPRITLMFCAFEGAPLILRLYGKGRAIHRRDADWNELIGAFSDLPGKRQIVLIEVEEVMTACGFAVPLMNFVGQREKLVEWAEKKGEAGIRDYWRRQNLLSFDGTPTGLFED
jgi:hypothetical protein